MRQCPECSGAFDDSVHLCPVDGSRLGAPDPLLGHVVEEKYRIEALLGRGGMGAVYRATQTRLERSVALKVIRQDCLAEETTIERFRREALALARIKHPNIVAVYDFGLDPKAGLFLVMELLDGHSLAKELGDTGPLEPYVALDTLAQVCSAVHAAHAAGVVHRDLKPANIHVERSGSRLVAKVLDFGVVRLQASQQTPDPAALTTAGIILGTPSYMSPEQCEGGPLDARSDVYALGCVLYEALTGLPPFRAPSLLALLRKHAFEVPEPPSLHAPRLLPAVDALVLKALAKDPSDRYASALELQSCIEAVAASVRRGAGVETTAAAVPPSPAVASGNLPQQMTSFIGREREIAAVAERLTASRLVTLCGIGGVGKTRLAVEIARNVTRQFSGETWLVELAPLKEPSLIAEAVASTLGIREKTDLSTVESVAAAVGDRRVLLVLDNCEHVVSAAAALVSALLAACPGLRVLATSRERLGVAGEVTWQVVPLSLPDATKEHEHEHGSEAARLFLDRVRLHNPHFEPIGGRWAAIAAICEKLEGIPLAIELAAARARVLTVEQILARLDDRFRLLRGTDRSSMHRQQTLRATIDWSYELLSDEERMLLARLSVFVGGCSLEAAEAVCGGDGIEPEDVLDHLARLVDRSLVIVDAQDGEARYRLLETIRQYGLEKLRATGEEAALLTRHRAWFIRFVDEAATHYSTTEEPEWLARIERDHENMRAVLRRYVRTGESLDDVTHVSCVLARYWEVKGQTAEALRWIETLMPKEAEMTGELRARFLANAGWVAKVRGRMQDARDLLERSSELWRVEGDRVGEARTLGMLAAAVHLIGDFDSAWAIALRSQELFEAEAYGSGITTTGNQLGLMAMDRGDYDVARTWFEHCLTASRDAGDRRSFGIALFNMAMVDWMSGDFERAEAQITAARACIDEVGDRGIGARTCVLFAAIALDQGRYEHALSVLEPGLITGAEIGDRVTVVNGLEMAARTLEALGHHRTAIVLVSAAAAIRAAYSIALPASYQKLVDDSVARARRAIGDDEADRATSEGRALDADQAIRLAFEAPRSA